jgi:hypothetical protein
MVTELIVAQPEAPAGRDPYDVLHVLPSAPHDLIAEIYWYLVGDLRPGSCPRPMLQARLRELNEAYSTVMAQGVRGPAYACGWQGRRGRPPSSPWQILHVTPGASPDVVGLAHRFWRQPGAAEFESVEEAYRELRSGEAAGSSRPVRPDNGTSDIQAEPAAPVSAAEEPAVEDTGGPGLMKLARAAFPSETQARFVVQAGSPRAAEAIGSRPFTIGTDPDCDLPVETVKGDERTILARVWGQAGRFMFHGIASVPPVLVNGEALVWAVLEDGDKLQIEDTVIRFEQPVAEGGAVAEMLAKEPASR